MPAVSELKSPAMRQRHWDKLMEITGATLPVIDGKFAPEFCLADLLALQLHKYVDDVGEVVDQANKEDKMEQTLKKLDETWKVVDFGFDKHQDTDVYLINLAEENFEMLEENQLIVQGMMASKFLATFEEWVTGWQKKLSSVSDILAQMQDTQRKWAYLETLFIGSDEVKKELPEDAERFAKVDVLFKEMLKHFKNMPNCVDSCAKPGLLKGLEAIADDLELCEKALADFLEAEAHLLPALLLRLPDHASGHPLQRQPAVGGAQERERDDAGRQGDVARGRPRGHRRLHDLQRGRGRPIQDHGQPEAARARSSRT